MSCPKYTVFKVSIWLLSLCWLCAFGQMTSQWFHLLKTSIIVQGSSQGCWELSDDIKRLHMPYIFKNSNYVIKHYHKSLSVPHNELCSLRQFSLISESEEPGSARPQKPVTEPLVTSWKVTWTQSVRTHLCHSFLWYVFKSLSSLRVFYPPPLSKSQSWTCLNVGGGEWKQVEKKTACLANVPKLEHLWNS